MYQIRPAKLVVATTILAISGCASHPDPIVDTKGVNETLFAMDWVECEEYSDQVVVGRGIAKSATTGAAVGAATGAISGNASDGAGYGAIWGGLRGGLKGNREKQNVFKRCLRGRGYRVLN